MAHKSAISMCFKRAGRAIVIFFSPPQKTVFTAPQSLSPSIDEQCGARKVINREKIFYCDAAHHTTYYFAIIAILWYSIPKTNLTYVAADGTGSIRCNGLVGRSWT